jgi:ATP-dependent DNA ligase
LRGVAPASDRCCAATMMTLAAFYMPAALAPGSAMPSLNGCGAGYSPSRSPQYRWPSCHRRPATFGRPLELSRVHWVRPELVVQVKYLTWTELGLLRQVVYQGIREDKPASEVRRPVMG